MGFESSEACSPLPPSHPPQNPTPPPPFACPQSYPTNAPPIPFFFFVHGKLQIGKDVFLPSPERERKTQP